METMDQFTASSIILVDNAPTKLSQRTSEAW